jgi:transposase-like protein
MSITMNEEIKRWTARRKSALVLEIIQGKTTVSEASRQFDLAPSAIEERIEQGKAGMENALRSKPEDVREQYEREIKTLQEAYGEAMLELRARKKCSPCWARKSHDRGAPAGTEGRRRRGLDLKALSVV